MGFELSLDENVIRQALFFQLNVVWRSKIHGFFVYLVEYGSPEDAFGRVSWGVCLKY